MKQINELLEEYDGDKDDPVAQREWLDTKMTDAIRLYGQNIRPDLLTQSMQNWQMQLLEFVIGMFTEDEQRGEAVNMFRTFAQHSRLVNLYNALVVSSEKRLVVAKK